MRVSEAPLPETARILNGAGRRILLVDDDPIQLKISQANLTHEGFLVYAAANAADALTRAKDIPFDAIISDVLMGDLDGFALCRLFRAEQCLSAVPIILVSAEFQEEADRKLALAVGANSLIERSPDFSREIEALLHSLDRGAVAQTSSAADELLHFQRVASQLTRLLNKSRHSEARYRALIESANDAISVLSPNGVILEANHRLAELLLYPNEQVVGRHIRDFAAAGFEQENVDQFESAAGGPAARAHVYPFKRSDGKTIYLSFTTATVDISGKTSVLSIGRDVTENVESARRLRDSEQNFRSILANIPDVIWSASLVGKYTFVSSNVAKIFGVAPALLLAGSIGSSERTNQEDLAHVDAAFTELLRLGKSFDIEYRWKRPDGEWGWLRNRASITRGPDGLQRVDGVASDITLQKQTEDELRQSQKMEALGLLTGGVAHDFNNILVAVLANSHFLIQDLSQHDPRRADAIEIREAAQRAAALTRQLLAFSRRQVLAPTSLDLNVVVTGVEKMLRRIIGEDVTLSIIPADTLGSVRADPSQIEQVIMNLVVNARDAMPTGGKVTIETANVSLNDKWLADNSQIEAGSYVMLSISDTGTGMDEKTRLRIFEPFFTTKEAGKSTGLGLSTSYGIVRQSGGSILVNSEVGRGTIFKVYLPMVAESKTGLPIAEAVSGTVTGSETILVIEDDHVLRALVSRILKEQGYRVIPAAASQEALAIARSSPGGIDLILTDVVMPNVSGPAIVRQIRNGSSLPRALFMSGYTDHAVLREDALQIGMQLIQKPFSPTDLLHKVREILDAAECPGGSESAARQCEQEV